MSGNGRGTMRAQGRTPPFLLIGLLVVLCILGFSYWNVSSKSSERASVIARLQEELQSLSSRKLEADKRSSETNTKLDEVVKMKASLETRLQTLEKENDDFRNQVDSRGNEVQSIQNELETKKDSLKKCEEDSNGIQQELQKLKEEVDALRQDAANKPAQCDLNACSDPVQTVFNVLINTLGRPQVENSLRNNPEYSKFISAGEAANPKAPDAIVNPVNPEQPVVNQGAELPVQQAQVNPQGQVPADLQGQAAVNQQPPVNQQEQGVPAGNQQQAQAPADQQGQVNPPVNAGDQGAIGQVQPPQDLQKAGQENVTKAVNESVLTTKVEGIEGNDKQEGKNGEEEDKQIEGQANDGKKDGEDGKKVESEDGKKSESGDGKKPESEDGKKPESEDGRKPESEDGRKAESEDGKKAESDDGKKAESVNEKKGEAEVGKKAEPEEENKNKDKVGGEEQNKVRNLLDGVRSESLPSPPAHNGLVPDQVRIVPSQSGLFQKQGEIISIQGEFVANKGEFVQTQNRTVPNLGEIIKKKIDIVQNEVEPHPNQKEIVQSKGGPVQNQWRYVPSNQNLDMTPGKTENGLRNNLIPLQANKDTGLNPGSDINSNLDVAHEADVHVENDRLLQTSNEYKLENTGNVINQVTTDMPGYQRDRQNDPLLQVQHDKPSQHVDYDGNMFANADIAAVRHDEIIDKAVDYNSEDDNEKPEDNDAWPQLNQPKANEGAPAAAMFPAVPLDSPDHIEADGLEEENGGEDEEGEEEGGDLKFKPQIPPNEVGKDNDAIDRLNRAVDAQEEYASDHLI